MDRSRLRRGTAAAAVTVGLIGVASAPPAVAFKDKDCSDFKSQKAAQKFFKKHNPKKDPHGLDADHDGIACEDSF